MFTMAAPRTRPVHRLLAIALILLCASACGGGDSAPPPAPPALVAASLELQGVPTSLIVGETAQVRAVARDASGGVLTGRPVTWTTSNSAILTVSGDGGLLAVSPGQAQVEGRVDGRSASATVLVRPVPAASISIRATPDQLEVGEQTTLVAEVRARDGSVLGDRQITWRSGDPGIVTVTSAGLLTAVAPGGPVEVIAEVDSLVARVSLSVVPARVRIVRVQPDTQRVIVGTSAPLTVTALDARGVAVAGRTVRWSSSNASVATVSSAGVVTAVSVGGPIQVAATIDSVVGSAVVFVRPVPVASVTVSLPEADVNIGTRLRASVSLADFGGNRLSGRAVEWRSTNATVASVDQDGNVTAQSPGTTRIVARSEDGVEGSAPLSVRGFIHRWTFNAPGPTGTTFRDDIGGAEARIVEPSGGRTVAAANGVVTLSGGSWGTAGYVALPAGLLRSKSQATIEVWATMNEVRNWSRIFDIGGGQANSLFMAWTVDRNPALDQVRFTIGGVVTEMGGRLAPYTRDVPQHIVLTIAEGGGSGGQTRVAAYLNGQFRGAFDTPHSLRDLDDRNAWLGRSQFSTDETASATYHEVRIHDRTYPPEAIVAMYNQGPVPDPVDGTLTIARPQGIRDTIRGDSVSVPLRAVLRDGAGRQYPVAGVRWSTNTPMTASIDSAGMLHVRRAGEVDVHAQLGASRAIWSATAVRSGRPAIPSFLATPARGALWEVPVALVVYVPTADGSRVDVRKAPDFYALNPLALDSVEARCLDYAARKKMMMEEGSRFRGYKNPTAAPSLAYRVVDILYEYRHTPASQKRGASGSGSPAYVDYAQVLQETGLRERMRQERIREVWLCESGFDRNYPSYDPSLHKTTDMRVSWESNMSSPVTGDISNSDRDNADLPVLDYTYTVYGINWRRSQAEAVHNVGHQLEAILSHAAQRQDGNPFLFWRQFVGQDNQGQWITGRAGWTHMPPNTTRDYDYHNTTEVPSDIEDWTPAGTGQRTTISRQTWYALTYPWPGVTTFGQREESQWYTYWMQNFPGRGNRIAFGSRWMSNWWAFVGDWDAAIRANLGLHAESQASATYRAASGTSSPRTHNRTATPANRQPGVPTWPIREAREYGPRRPSSR